MKKYWVYRCKNCGEWHERGEVVDTIKMKNVPVAGELLCPLDPRNKANYDKRDWKIVTEDQMVRSRPEV